MHRLRGKLTYANVISTLCLFLLLGGGAAYAANQLPKNSVGAKQLKKGAVTPAKLTKATKKALLGPAGPQGLPGTPGAPGATNVIVRVGKLEGEGAEETEEGIAEVKCQGSEVAVGGGGYMVKPGTFLWGSEPITANTQGLSENELKDGEKPTGWRIGGEGTGGEDDVPLQAYVICASP